MTHRAERRLIVVMYILIALGFIGVGVEVWMTKFRHHEEPRRGAS